MTKLAGGGIGIGVTVGGARAIRTPAKTHANMTAIAGAALIGAWDMRDAVFDGSDNATSLPGRIGGTMALTAGPGAKKTTLNGQTCITVSNTTPVRYESGNLSAAIKTQYAVAVIPATNSADYNVGFDIWVSGGGWNYCTIAPGTSALVGNFSIHTVNGVATDNVTAGTLCIISSVENPAKGVLKAALGHPTVPMWRAPTLYGCYLSTIPDAATHAAILVELKRSFKVDI